MFTSMPSSVLLAFTPADESARRITARLVTRVLSRITRATRKA